MCGVERELFSVADRAYAFRVDPELHEILPGSQCPPLTQPQVVLGCPALVAVPLDGHNPARVLAQHLSVGIERLSPAVVELRAVGAKKAGSSGDSRLTSSSDRDANSSSGVSSVGTTGGGAGGGGAGGEGVLLVEAGGGGEVSGTTGADCRAHAADNSIVTTSVTYPIQRVVPRAPIPVPLRF